MLSRLACLLGVLLQFVKQPRQNSSGKTFEVTLFLKVTLGEYTR